MSNITEVVFILDRSGSMSGLEKETIGGFNSLLEKQKKEEGEAIVSTILFDNEVEVLHNRKNIKDVEKISEKEYYVRGTTALLDAIGTTIARTRTAQEKDAIKPEKTLFIITTDGMENASTEYSYDSVKKLVEKMKTEFGWEFLFLGANIDAVDVAGKFGVSANRAVRYESDSAGTALNYSVMSKIVSKVRYSKSAAEMSSALNEDDLREIEEDYEKRKK